MKAKLVTLCVLVVVFALTLSFSVPTPAAPQPAGSKAVPAATAQPNAAPAPAGDPQAHPEIRDAIASLRTARAHLDHAAHDFGGHRVEAIKAIDEALNQLNICLKYDK